MEVDVIANSGMKANIINETVFLETGPILNENSKYNSTCRI